MIRLLLLLLWGWDRPLIALRAPVCVTHGRTSCDALRSPLCWDGRCRHHCQLDCHCEHRQLSREEAQVLAIVRGGEQ